MDGKGNQHLLDLTGEHVIDTTSGHSLVYMKGYTLWNEGSPFDTYRIWEHFGARGDFGPRKEMVEAIGWKVRSNMLSLVVCRATPERRDTKIVQSRIQPLAWTQ